MFTIEGYFFLYKIACLFSGVFIIYLGYKLCVKGIFNELGDLDTQWGNFKLVCKRASPALIFVVFGGYVLLMTTGKGFNYESKTRSVGTVKPIRAITTP